MTDYNQRPIKTGTQLIDKWGCIGTVAYSNGRTNWVTKDGTYWLCDAIIEAWELTIQEET